ncbi:probable DEAD/DEAH box helicase [Natronomonas moolapensis 8.8.11]|uniref:Probable DEAD/DEAH box helicase n=2 Tax=Halobacteriales TaxID=2235 RepID=M1XSL1_NATM8|nr:DEAD/DEAH box helicase [Natronomonas moolapensis]CCQ37331.1 probable DEAD/DEAH box helicase [Natronomonas moolapensis 8.8.11]
MRDSDTRPTDGDRLLEAFPRAGLGPDSASASVLTIPAREAETVPAETVLDSVLADRYPFELYSHQAAALRALRADEHVCVSTSTASGKTHVYGVEIARRLLDAGVLAPDGTRAADRNEGATALCLYPTKALTNDQRDALDALYEELGLDIRVRVYDGDTPTAERRSIREDADVVLTNVQALNVYLEHHDRWSRFYSALEVVAVDESHTYTGVQGMHAAWILRRLERVLEYWGGDPTYALASATVGNPAAHSEALLGAPVTVVDDDGSPRGARDVVLWNPPPRERSDGMSSETASPAGDGATTGEASSTGDRDVESRVDDGVADRVPASVDAPKVFGHLADDVGTLLFCPSRKLTELSVRRANAHVQANPRTYGEAATARIAPYHAGLGKRTRHARETEFKTDALCGLATTSALELGIDIGSLEATVLMGYPGQRQSFRQRIGRAGRGTDRSLAVLVADHRTLDQYVVSNPEYLLESDVEDAVVDTSNDAVFASHLLCAADEIALGTDDFGSFADADRLRAGIEMWRRAGKLEGHREAAVHYVGPPRPQTDVNVYGTDGTDYRLTLADGVDRDRWGLPEELDLEPVDRNRAARDYHEGAVRLHSGQQFEVVAVDESRPTPVIELVPVDVDYYTRTRTDVNVVDADAEESRTVNGFDLHFGRGTVLVHHDAYDRVSIGNSETVDAGIPTGTDPIAMETQLCWVEVPKTIERTLVETYRDYGVETGVDADAADPPHLGYVAGLHAAEHATIQTAPLELRVDKGDLGGLATLVLDSHYAADGAGSARDPDGSEAVRRVAASDSVPDPGSVPESLRAAEHEIDARSGRLDGPPASGWFIYDGVEGGLGFARAIYESFESLAVRARDQLRECRCGRPNGCPACTFDENCGNDNRPLLRASAIDILELLLGEASIESFDAYDGARGAGSETRRPALFYS